MRVIDPDTDSTLLAVEAVSLSQYDTELGCAQFPTDVELGERPEVVFALEGVAVNRGSNGWPITETVCE